VAEDNRLQFRVDPDMKAWLADRTSRTMNFGSPDLRALAELRMWRGHLALELRQQRWTLAEIGCIADILNGTIFNDVIGTAALFAEIADAVDLDPDIWGKKWEIDEKELVSKVGRLGPTAAHALTDAVSRWWATQSDHTIEGWERVGVRIAAERGES
jgi:hypothetical protein